ncbi:MAG: hypothetical protein ACJZ9F_12985 [Rhodospirillaceae bacterium]
MSGNLFPYLIPFGVALAAAGSIRLLFGSTKGAQYAGVSFLVGFSAAWHWLLLAPWVPYDPLSRVIYIAISGALAGLALDMFAFRRSWAVIVHIVFVLGCVWSTLTGELLGAPPDSIAKWLRFGLYLALWLGLLARLGSFKSEGPTALVTVLMLALGLGFVAQMSGQGEIGATAYTLAAAFAGLLALCWVLYLAVGNVIVLGGGGAVLGLSMILTEPGAETSVIALVFLLLIPFADGTAKRIPLGPQPIRTALYPLALMIVSLLPIGLAGAIAFLLGRA